MSATRVLMTEDKEGKQWVYLELCATDRQRERTYYLTRRQAFALSRRLLSVLNGKDQK